MRIIAFWILYLGSPILGNYRLKGLRSKTQGSGLRDLGSGL